MKTRNVTKSYYQKETSFFDFLKHIIINPVLPRKVHLIYMCVQNERISMAIYKMYSPPRYFCNKTQIYEL